MMRHWEIGRSYYFNYYLIARILSRNSRSQWQAWGLLASMKEISDAFHRSLRYQFQRHRSPGGIRMFPYIVYSVLLFAAACSRPTCVQGNFTVSASSYNCSSNLICLAGAHRSSNGSFVGRLSLIDETNGNSTDASGIGYYNIPVRMLDPVNRRSASFNTSFVINEIPQLVNSTTSPPSITRGDGMAFVISADNSSKGGDGGNLGFFNYATNSFKSIVVEFDNYKNGPPINDINDNHISFDFKNATSAAVADAANVDVYLSNTSTLYAWVEYSSETKQLEVRISYSNSRPLSYLLQYEVDLFDVVEEYMWVGFSGATGATYSYYYIGDWSFESYGIDFPPAKAQKKVGVIVGISVGVPLLLGIAGILIFVFVKRQAPGTKFSQMHLGSSSDRMLQLSGMPREYSYKQLSVATGAFSEQSKLGQGGFGSVYRGVLPTSGIPVAVKKISGDSNQGEREFTAEVSIINQLRHRNLIHLMGWCKGKGKYLLVYELMPNGSLDKALFSPDEQHSSLSWSQRLNIITGTAAAIDYLHQGWKKQVIHRDIKASNIMLDDEWNAKLGDFGLARLVDHKRPAETTIVAGTLGYIAPEAAASGRFTDKTDVFAFGAVALEIACGRTVFARQAPPDEMLLVDWVWQHLSEGDLLGVVDKRLGEYDIYWMEVVLLMGLLCSHPNPMARPSIRHVVQVLAGDAPVPPVPVFKPASSFRKDTQFVTIEDLDNVNSRTSASGPSDSDLAFLGSD